MVVHEGPRLTLQSIKVLCAFVASFGDELTGADIIKGVHLPSGSVYPILFKFEKAGLLTSRWEKREASELKRPRRKYYKLTAAGSTLARRALNELNATVRPLPAMG